MNVTWTRYKVIYFTDSTIFIAWTLCSHNAKGVLQCAIISE